MRKGSPDKAPVPIYPKDPRWRLTAPKPLEDRPVADQEKFVLRLPAGMRDRIKRTAARNKRSMNTEIVYALESLYPPEPDIFDVLESVHRAINVAMVGDTPYRSQLIEALDGFSERIASGIEPDQFQPDYRGPEHRSFEPTMQRMDRWKRAQINGVVQGDLEREISRGLLRSGRGDRVLNAIRYFEQGKPALALGLYRLQEVKFAEPERAFGAIEKDLRAYYEENWGDPNDTPEWERDDYEDR